MLGNYCISVQKEMDLYSIAKPCLEHYDFSLPICLMYVPIYKLLLGQTSSQPAYSVPLQTVIMLIKQFLLAPPYKTLTQKGNKFENTY